jgi:16S rRNA (uracil1498-N3)-methyltransferase
MEIFYSNEINGDIITLSPKESAHCIRVMRNRIGSEVRVSGGDGNLYKCEVTDDNPESVHLRIISIEGGFGKHNYFLHIGIAPTKNIDRFEWFLEKGTEIGIDKVTPLLCDHSERKIFRQDRGERVIIAAAKQSLKGDVPSIDPLTSFHDFIAEAKLFDGGKFIAYCDSELIDNEGIPIRRISINKALSQTIDKYKILRTMVLIGPEGDFSLEEIKMAADAGFIPISLGESRLRTETAALVATLAHYLFLLS